MAHQQHANDMASTSPQIDALPTVKGPTPEDHQSEKDAQDTSGADAAPNSVLPDMSAPQIDVSDDPPMVTPLKLLQRESKWVDCSFCKRMTKTKVQMVEQGEEPSGYVKHRCIMYPLRLLPELTFVKFNDVFGLPGVLSLAAVSTGDDGHDANLDTHM